VHHDVEDVDHWLKSTLRDEVFGPLGITGLRTFVDPTNPQRVGLLFDVPDMDALLAALPTPEFAKAEAADGVVAESIVLLVESQGNEAFRTAAVFGRNQGRPPDSGD
jgi:hypothetical protein